MSTPFDVALLVSARDEEAELPHTLAAIEALRARWAGTRRVQCVFVDDASQDGTQAILRRFARRSDSVEVVVRERSEGLHAALAAGLARVRAATTVTMEAHLAFPVDVIDAMVALFEATQVDVVVAQRVWRADPAWRTWGSRVVNVVLHGPLGFPLRDVFSLVRVWRTAVARDTFAHPALSWYVAQTYRQRILHVEVPFDRPRRRASHFGAAWLTRAAAALLWAAACERARHWGYALASHRAPRGGPRR